jgi:hypothetical protein
MLVRGEHLLYHVHSGVGSWISSLSGKAFALRA